MPIIAFGLPHKGGFGLQAVWKGLSVIAVTYNHSRNERENDICLESSMRIVQTSNAIMQDDEGISCSEAQLHSRDCFMAHVSRHVVTIEVEWKQLGYSEEYPTKHPHLVKPIWLKLYQETGLRLSCLCLNSSRAWSIQELHFIATWKTGAFPRTAHDLLLLCLLLTCSVPDILNWDYSGTFQLSPLIPAIRNRRHIVSGKWEFNTRKNLAQQEGCDMDEGLN